MVTEAKPPVIHYGSWRNRLLSGAVAMAFAVLLWFGGEPGLVRSFAMVFLGVVGVLCLLPSETRFAFAHGVIERRWMFLGVLPVFRYHLPLSQFRQVCWQSVGSMQEGAGRTWKVGLERVSGRPFYVNYFNAGPDRACDEAKRFAFELSKLTGLPLSRQITIG